MKTKVKRIQVDRFGVAESNTFTIKASAHAFKILSDGLYSDKILAIIRELSCNAYDAHVDEGTLDKPFSVHLPNSLEPWFSIRDYGVGLCHENIMHLYTTYFDSTKTDSNEFIGALGLGSKSPFSYVETFTVTSYFNGEKRVYIADLGEAGVPQISLLEGFPIKTTELNGLEVKLAVRKSDFGDFEWKAKEIYKRFDPVPEVVGVPSFEVKKVEYALEGNGWRVITNSDSYNRHVYAIQGTVAYPIDFNAMRDVDDAQKRLFNGLHIELDFEIGELDIAASREALGYDKRTSANIMKKVGHALKEIGVELNKNFKACKTLWEAKTLFHTTFGTDYYDPLRRLVTDSKIKIMWKGEEIGHAKLDGHTTEQLSISGFNVRTETRRSSSRVKQKRYAFGMNNDHINVTASDKVIFFVDDLEKGGGVARVRYFVDEHKNANNIEVYMIRSQSKRHLANLRRELGSPKFGKISELPKPPKQTRIASSELRGNGYVWVGKKNKPTHEWNNTSVDFRAGGLYIPVHRCTALNKSGVELVGFSAAIERAVSLGVIDKAKVNIYGIPKGQVSKLKGKWINVMDYVKAEVTKKANDPAIVSQVGRGEMLSKFESEVRRASYMRGNLKMIAKAVKDQSSEIVRLSAHLVMADDNRVSGALLHLTKYFDIKIKNTRRVDLVAMWNSVMDKYPMIEWPFDTWGQLDTRTVQKVVEYIDLVDRK